MRHDSHTEVPRKNTIANLSVSWLRHIFLTRIFVAFIIYFLSNMLAHAVDLDELTEKVRTLCRGDEESGQILENDSHRTVEIGDSRDTINFSSSEWRGVQQVLREHQEADNRDYRACVRELTPLFLEAAQESSKTCEYENDGSCDVPDFLPCWNGRS